jgi:hypothetical protein
MKDGTVILIQMAILFVMVIWNSYLHHKIDEINNKLNK